jgi:hypothetical protein
MHPLKILCLHRQHSAVGYYRTWTRARLLKEMGHEVTWFEDEPYHLALKPKNKVSDRNLWPDEWLRENFGVFDIIMVDRALSNEEWARFAGYRHYTPNCRMIVDFDDDFTCVPWWNPAQANFQPGQEAYEAGLNHLRMAEMTTVSTEALRERFKDRCHAIRVVPNRIDPGDWLHKPVDPERADDPSVRVLYGGAHAHLGDLDEMREGIEGVVRRQPVPWRLICFGALPHWLYDLAKEQPGKVVALPWAQFTLYPTVTAWGGFDLALAPLASTEKPPKKKQAKPCLFNAAKSNIKWQEATIQGFPLVCSNVGAYADIPDGCAIKVENTPAAWAEALRNCLQEKVLRQSVHKAAKQAVYDEWTIDKGEANLQILLEETMDRPRIICEDDTILPSEVPADPA